MKALILAALAALVCTSVTANSDTPAPFPEFEAKRLGLPKSGTSRFITVQIDPTVVVPAPAETPDTGTEIPGSAYAWFWNDVPAAIEESGADRIDAALAALSRASGGANDVATPRLTEMRDLADRYGIEILTASLDTDVSPALALAVLAVESSGRADAVSSAGAHGLMQLMPATAERFGVVDTSASENIRGGVDYLDWLLRHFDGDTVLALAGYNAGEGAVAEHGGVPPYAETRDYVPKVLATWRVARMICKTPPVFVDDGCVFEGNLSPR